MKTKIWLYIIVLNPEIYKIRSIAMKDPWKRTNFRWSAVKNWVEFDRALNKFMKYSSISSIVIHNLQFALTNLFTNRNKTSYYKAIHFFFQMQFSFPSSDTFFLYFFITFLNKFTPFSLIYHLCVHFLDVFWNLYWQILTGTVFYKFLPFWSTCWILRADLIDIPP